MATSTAPKQTLQVGSRVEIAEKGRGTVRFMGPVKFSSKDNWVGIELDAPNGNHDGAVKGVRYFKCNTNHGLFVTKDKVILLKKVAKPAGTLSIKSPDSSKTPSPASSAPSSPRGESTSSTSTSLASASATLTSPPPSPASVASATSAAPTPTEVPPATESAPVLAEDSGEKGKSVITEKSSSSSTNVQQQKESPDSSSVTEAVTTTSLSSTPSTPKTPVPVITTQSPSPASARSASQASASLSAESAALFTTLQELSDFKKDAQQKLKALQKSLDEVSKEKEHLTKELDKEKKERDKQMAKLQKKFDDEKEQLQRAWEEEKEEMTEEIATINDTLEMMTLDKELAEEKAEALEKQLNQIKTKYKLGDLLDDDMNDNSDEDDEDNDHSSRGKGSDDEEISALKLQIQRLTDALMKLKDLSVMEKKESEKRIKQLERENANIPVLEDKIAKLKEDAKKANERIEQLKEQLDDALGAEDMIEELSQKKLELEEQVQELQQAVEDLEQLQQVSEELEENHAEVEKQLRTALYKKEIQYLDSITKIKNQQAEIEDRDKTIDQFREKVNSLQHALKTYEEKEEELAAEARQLSNKSQALIDQNIQLKSQITKALAMSLERELSRLDVSQARKQLAFIQAFLPEEILSRDNESLLLLLCLDRILFKSNLLLGHLQRYYKLDQLSFNLINDVEIRYDSEELLFAWELYWGVSKVRFYCSGLRKVLHDPNICPPDTFLKAGRAALDLLPYESVMDALLQLLKKEELNHNYDISIFQNIQDKMSRIVEQYLVREESGLTDSNENLPIRRASKDHGILCLPGWKSLRQCVDSILFVENVFLVLHHQLRSFVKSEVVIGSSDGSADAATSPKGQLNIPIRLVRDTIDVCRKLHKHLQEKPSLPRHYASKLERSMQRCFTRISGAVEVMRQLLSQLLNTAVGQDAAGKERAIKALLPSLLVNLESSDIGAEDVAKDSVNNETAEDEELEKGKEKEKEEIDQDGQEGSDEWKWLSALLEDTYTTMVAISDKVTNSSNFIKPDATINITPISPVSAPAQIGGKQPPASPLPLMESPTSPSLRATESVPAWKQRADSVRSELAAAASVRAKLLDAETLAQERLVRLTAQENEIKEHISRYNVLQMHLTALQKKEAELSEKMEKQIAEHVSQEKMYEDAMETIQKENEQLRQQIRSLRVDIRNLEHAKKEAEEQRAVMPSLEFVSAEIKALKRALLLVRRNNTELLAREGQKRLRTMLPPISSSEERLLSIFTPLDQQLQQDQDSDDGLSLSRDKHKNPRVVALHKHNVETQQFLDQIHSVKAANKIIDLTLAGSVAPAQQWANKRLTVAKVEAQSKLIKQKLGNTIAESSEEANGAKFASFPSINISRVLSAEAQAVGKLALPPIEPRQTAELRSQMQGLLAQLKGGADVRKRVHLTPHQLHHVHSMLL